MLSPDIRKYWHGFDVYVYGIRRPPFTLPKHSFSEKLGQPPEDMRVPEYVDFFDNERLAELAAAAMNSGPSRELIPAAQVFEILLSEVPNETL